MSRLPVIGTVLNDQFAMALSKLISIWRGDKDPLDRALTVQDLIDTDIVSFRANKTAANGGVMDAEYKNLVVDTLHIADEAVTIPVAGSFESTIGVYTTATTLLTVTADAGLPGKTVSAFNILFTGSFWAPSTPDDFTVDLYLDGVLKQTVGSQAKTGSYAAVTLGFVADAPLHGERTIVVKATANSVTLSALRGSLLIIGTKR